MFERLNKLGFKIYGGNGGYMCWVDITAGSGQTALEFQKGLLEIAGVQLGGSGWNDRTGRYMRLSFLTPMEKIVIAFDAIEKYTLSLNYTPTEAKL
jgi:aspartate/methionine/tyrosine aminotransferase